jgi:hypothetical protein
LDVLVHAYKRDAQSSAFPVLLENQQRYLDMFYPDQAQEASRQNNNLLSSYVLKNSNVYAKLNFVERELLTHPAEMFKYRLRTRP